MTEPAANPSAARDGDRAAPRNPRPYENVLELIGWTPIVRLNHVVDGARTPVYGKAEFFNPGGSLKDRIGLAMIEAAENDGRLKPGGVIVEGTAGNTGVGLAIAAALKGYRCIFTMSDKFSQEKVRLLKAFGAEVVVTPSAVPPDHPDNYTQVAKRITEETPGAVFADQFYNPVNPETHYHTTGPEIWSQTAGRLTHFVAASGTGGTISGVGRYLKEQNPDIRVIAGDPEGSVYAHYAATGEVGESHPYKLEGVGNDKIPDTLWFDVIDEYRGGVTDREAFHMARRLTREEGLFVGGSAGLITHVAVQLAHEVDDPDAMIVCMLPDTGERYLSKLYNDEWMRENRLLDTDRMTADDMVAAKDGATPPLVRVGPTAEVRQALTLIKRHGVSQLPVIHEGDCVGSVSEATLMAGVIEDPTVLDDEIETIMDAPFPVIDSHMDMSAVGRLLTRSNPAVLVRRDGQLTGILTRYDVVEYLTG